MSMIYESEKGFKFYSNNTVVIADGTRGTYEGVFVEGKPEGVFKLHYDDGLIEKECTYKDGIETGLFRKSYYITGVLRTESNYKDGKEEGLFRIYYENGKLQAEATYKNGVLCKRTNYNLKGNIVQ